MLKLNELIGSTIVATDGELGKVKDAIFDDRTWAIRYLVVDAGSWLSSHEVVLAPQSVSRAQPSDDRLTVRLSEEEIRRSRSRANVDTVSDKEEELRKSYRGYGPDWQGVYPGGWGYYPIGGPVAPAPREPASDVSVERKRDELEQREVHLRSFQEVKNYNLCAGDDEFGHVDDLMVDENEWVIRYLDVDTLNYVPSKHVFLRPDDVSDLDWGEQLFRLRLSRDQVLGAPTAPPR